MGITERKERGKQEIRKQITTAALELFHKNGYESVTIRQIAAKIEYSPSTIYLYFKDKDDIFFNIYEEGFRKFYSAQQSIISIADPFEKLKKHGEAYIQFALNNKDLYDIMFLMRVKGIAAAKKSGKVEFSIGYKSYQFLTQNVKDCIEAGYFREGDPNAIAFAIWSLVHGISSLIIRERTAIMPDKYLDKIIKGSLEICFLGLQAKRE